MSDLEKVIKGLEKCKTAPELKEECAGCPYDDGQEDCIARMAADALALLDNQAHGRTAGGYTMGKMICTKEAREACALAYMCEENAEVMDGSECADLIVKMEAVKWE